MEHISSFRTSRKITPAFGAVSSYVPEKASDGTRSSMFPSRDDISMEGCPESPSTVISPERVETWSDA